MTLVGSVGVERPFAVLAGDGGADGTCLLDGTIDSLRAVADRAGLQPDGVPAEVLLAQAYARLGAHLIPLLRGAFSLVLWDAERQEALLVRDHIGDRGLVWAHHGGGVVFATEIVDLLAVLGRTPGPDEIALAHWLAVSGMPEDRTLFAGVRRVRNGHLLRVGLHGRVSSERWWMPPQPSPARIAYPEAVRAVRGALDTAVTRAIDDGGDTGAAVLLSGGLDSSAIAAIAAQDGRVSRSYTAVFPGFESADETPLVDQTVDALGFSSTRVHVDGGGILGSAAEYVQRWLLPPVSPNLFFWLPLLRAAAAEGTTVLLDGQGGDEAFALSPYLLADKLRRGNVLGAVGLMGRVPGANHRPPPRAVAEWLYAFGVKGALPPGLEAARRRWRREAVGAPAWLAPRLAWAATEIEPAEDFKRLAGPRWWSFLVATTADGAGPTLAYDHIRQRDAMAGLRSRHPLADPDVVDLLLSLPPELAFHARHSRPLLRDAVAGDLPDAVRLRRGKSGFNAPFHSALRGPDLQVIRELLGGRDALIRDYTRSGFLEDELLRAIPDDRDGMQMWALHVWRLTTAELWMRACAGNSQFPQAFAPSAVHVAERLTA